MSVSVPDNQFSHPLVSILVPAYNAGQWITATLESARRQDWPNKEIIVVDDGSKDDTFQVARKFESANVTVVTQPNSGAAAARNKAFSLSRGDYIQWLDADDLLAPGKISSQVRVAANLRDGRRLLSAAWGSFYFRPSKAKFLSSPLWQDTSPAEWLRFKLGRGAFMQTATWLVSRELSTAAGPWNTSLLGDDDGEYFCRVLLASNGVTFVPDSKVLYREIAGARLSAVGFSARKLEAHFRSMKLHIAYLRSTGDDAVNRQACLDYLQRYLFYFYQESPDIVRQMDALAAELGGKLQPPGLRSKYAWLAGIFGWRTAKRAQFFFPKIRTYLERNWDHLTAGLG
ncbi:MAG TPA: glycosyltransferase family 2 protein [Candidatus Didemnitutus sp.]|jgi:glycosyltransferase involved in cell wall biosynthesis